MLLTTRSATVTLWGPAAGRASRIARYRPDRHPLLTRRKGIRPLEGAVLGAPAVGPCEVPHAWTNVLGRGDAARCGRYGDGTRPCRLRTASHPYWTCAAASGGQRTRTVPGRAGDRKTLYPILEGPITGDDPTTRRLYAFDIATGRNVERLPDYRVAPADLLVSDATALDGSHLVVLERDNFQGTAAHHKRGFVVDLRRLAPEGTLAKRQVVDLLDLHDPGAISLPGRPGDIGLGEHFSMPYLTIESVLPVGGNRLAIVNDTNFGSTGRNPTLPDPSDFIIVQIPGLPGDDEEGRR